MSLRYIITCDKLNMLHIINLNLGWRTPTNLYRLLHHHMLSAKLMIVLLHHVEVLKLHHLLLNHLILLILVVVLLHWLVVNIRDLLGMLLLVMYGLGVYKALRT